MNDLAEGLRVAMAHQHAGRLDAAEGIYRRILEHDPGQADALHLLGGIKFHQGRAEEAAVLLRRAIAQAPDAPEPRYNLALVLASQGSLDEAAGCLDQALALNPDFHAARSALGNLRRRQGDVDGAMAHFAEVLRRDPTRFQEHLHLGGLCLERRDLAGAESHFRQVVALAPQRVEGHINLGVALKEQGRLHDAAQHCLDALALNPDHPAAHLNLGAVRKEQGRLEEAVASYRAVLAVQPNLVEAHNNLGNALRELGEAEQARVHLEQAVRLDPNHGHAWLNLAGALNELGHLEQAMHASREALRLMPGNLLVLGQLATLQEKTSCLADAAATVAQGLILAPGDPMLQLVAAKLERRQGHGQAALARLAGREEPDHVPEALQAGWHHELGLLHDQEGQSEQAFRHFLHANAIKAGIAARRGLDKGRFLRELDLLAARFTPEWLASWRPLPDTGEEGPVFLVGFPRSGTTLLEQVLDSHPALQSMEEKPALIQTRDRLLRLPGGYPDGLACLTPEDRDELVVLYHQQVARHLKRRPGSLLVDKLPLNLFLAPLAWRLFPRAKFLLALRHPCDCCLSCFMQDFQLNEAMVHFLDLEDTATLYARIMGLWRQYAALLPLAVHEVKYESLVGDFTGEVRGVLDFLGVGWDDGVLAYATRARGGVHTPSYHQVTRPIYQSARYRFRRYAEFMAPVMPLLAPSIAAFGYGDGGGG